MPSPSIFPTVHNNGTSANELRAGYDEAADALFEFTSKWGNITFNARDYYVQGSTAFDAACTEREEMGHYIKAVTDYINGIREHLYA